MQIPYEELVELAEQLSIEQQKDLVTRLQKRIQPMTANEKIQALKAVQVDVAVLQDPSNDRADWYDDEGR